MKRLLVKVRITNIHDFTNVTTLWIKEVSYYKSSRRKVLHETMKRIHKREKKKKINCLGIFGFHKDFFFIFSLFAGWKISNPLAHSLSSPWQGSSRLSWPTAEGSAKVSKPGLMLGTELKEWVTDLDGILSLGALVRVCLHGSADSLTIHSNLATLLSNCDALPGPCLCLDKRVIDHCLLRLSPVYGVPGSDTYTLDATRMSWRLPRPGSCCLVTLLSWPCSQAHLCQPAVTNWSRHLWLLPRI